jgi:hypothetical protein
MINPTTITAVAEAAEAFHFPVSATVVLITGFIAAATLGSIAWFRTDPRAGWKKQQGSAEDPQASQPSKADSAGYDRGIIPAETAARQKREGSHFKETPESGTNSDTTSGYTVDREGLMNNYPIEPEMYVNKPGDLKKEKEALEEERAREVAEVNSAEGNKGPGVI